MRKTLKSDHSKSGSLTDVSHCNHITLGHNIGSSRFQSPPLKSLFLLFGISAIRHVDRNLSEALKFESRRERELVIVWPHAWGHRLPDYPYQGAAIRPKNHYQSLFFPPS